MRYLHFIVFTVVITGCGLDGPAPSGQNEAGKPSANPVASSSAPRAKDSGATRVATSPTPVTPKPTARDAGKDLGGATETKSTASSPAAGEAVARATETKPLASSPSGGEAVASAAETKPPVSSPAAGELLVTAPAPGAAESKPEAKLGSSTAKAHVFDQTRNVAPGHEWTQIIRVRRKETIVFQFSSDVQYSVRLAAVGQDRVEALIESSKTVKKADILLETKSTGQVEKTITVEPGAVEFRVKNLGRKPADIRLRTSTTDE
jgi:hypothetical protein